MPVAGAQGIDQAEGGGAPAQPGALGDQPKGDLPLGQPGDLLGPLSGVVEVAEPAPDRFRHHQPSRCLDELRHPHQTGSGDHRHGQKQQGQQPAPTEGSGHQGHGQQQSPPGIARISEEHGGHQPGGQQEHQGAATGIETRLQQGRQQQGPGQGQPGAGDVGVVEQAGQTPWRVAAGLEMPDHQAAEGLEGSVPAPPELAQARENHRHGGRHQHQSHPTAGRGGGEVGLEAPEGPEEGQPVAQAHPGEPAAVGAEAAQHHQGRHQQQQAVRPAGQERTPAPAAEDQGHQQEQATEKGTGRQEEHTDLKTAPTQGASSGRPLGQQPTIKGLQKGGQVGLANGGWNGSGRVEPERKREIRAGRWNQRERIKSE